MRGGDLGQESHDYSLKVRISIGFSLYLETWDVNPTGPLSSLSGSNRASPRSPQGSPVTVLMGCAPLTLCTPKSISVCFYFLWNALACVLDARESLVINRGAWVSSLPQTRMCSQTMSLKESLITQSRVTSLSPRLSHLHDHVQWVDVFQWQVFYSQMKLSLLWGRCCGLKNYHCPIFLVSPPYLSSDISAYSRQV